MKMILISLGFIGLIATYLFAVLRYVKPPFKWVIEINIPGMAVIKKVWEPGIHFLWFPVKPFMYVRNELNCADETIIATVGVDDKNLGGKSPVEFTDVSAGVEIQIVMMVLDPIKATYSVDDYKKAAINRTEANIRRLLGAMTLDAAIKNLDARSEVAKETFRDVNEALSGWGIALTNPGKEITIVDFILTPKTMEERELVLKAEKEYKQKVKQAEATKAETILLKQGEAEGIRLIRDAEGKGEAAKVHLLAQELEMSPEDAINYLLKLGMLKALEGSTIIATSESGRLNAPIDLAATLFAIDNARKKAGEKDKGGDK